MEHRGNIPPRYAIRWADLRHWHVITVSCPACGHKGWLDAAALGRGSPDYTRLMDLERSSTAGDAAIARKTGSW